MSVIVQVQVVKTPFAGYPDPSLPSGTWTAQTLSVGDGSSGQNEIDLVFSPSAAPFDSQYYSLEHFAVTTTLQTNTQGDLRIINLGAFILARAYSFGLLRDAANSEAHVQGRSYALLPIFLGQQQAQATTTLVAFRLPNIDTEVLTFSGEGYYWSVRSLNAPGGPSRPVQGLYSR